MDSISSEKWKSYFWGITTGIIIVAIYLVISWLINIVSATKKIQKEIDQSLTSGKFDDFQKNVNNLQNNFPAGAGLSKENISRIVEILGINKENNSSVEDKDKKTIKTQK